MILSSLAEVLSLGAILPFLGILVNPNRAVEILMNLPFGLDAIFLGKSADQLLVFITVVFIFAIIFSGMVRILSQYVLIRFSHSIGADFSARMVRLTLYQPYIIHCSKNSGDFLNMLTVRVNETVYGVLVPTLTLVSSIFLGVAILMALFIIDPYVAFGSLLIFSLVYILMSLFTQRKLTYFGDIMHIKSSNLIKILQEIVGGIRDILLDGTQSNFLRYYLEVDVPLRQARCKAQFISNAPKYVIEVSGMILVALIALYLSSQSRGMYGAIPVIGAMALGAQKLLPIMQACFFSWSQMRTYRNSLIDVVEMLEQPINFTEDYSVVGSLRFCNQITFEKVSFKYDDQYILNGVSFSISRGERIGIVGRSGGGKSTLANLMMGLLTPNSGIIYVDGVRLDAQNLRAFQHLIAHVPQDIFLVDASIAENIAFGIPLEKIDLNLVRKAARSAHLHEIESWRNGYETKVGERGLLLSGGQKQRIGIARAMYKQAELIIFDEATSALDTSTEAIVIDAINSLPKEITLVLIAHRLSTLEKCTKILEVVDGQVIQYDRFGDYISHSGNKVL
jgi:ATP-binding cassette subfamily B protein